MPPPHTHTHYCLLHRTNAETEADLVQSCSPILHIVTGLTNMLFLQQYCMQLQIPFYNTTNCSHVYSRCIRARECALSAHPRAQSGTKSGGVTSYYSVPAGTICGYISQSSALLEIGYSLPVCLLHALCIETLRTRYIAMAFVEPFGAAGVTDLQGLDQLVRTRCPSMALLLDRMTHPQLLAESAPLTVYTHVILCALPLPHSLSLVPK